MSKTPLYKGFNRSIADKFLAYDLKFLGLCNCLKSKIDYFDYGLSTV